MGFITNGQRLTNHACVMTPSGGQLGRLGDAPLARALFPPPPSALPLAAPESDPLSWSGKKQGDLFLEFCELLGEG